jgi:hypothetical protein
MSAIDNKDMAEAMEFDGVLPETLVILVEAQFRAGFVKPGLRPPHEPPLPRQPCREGQEHEREQHLSRAVLARRPSRIGPACRPGLVPVDGSASPQHLYQLKLRGLEQHELLATFLWLT